MISMRSHPLRTVAVATLCALSGSLACAATVEFKLNPDLKGRDYMNALKSVSQVGKYSASVGNGGVYTIDAASEADAKRIATTLREKSSVLWATPVAAPLPADTVIPAPNFHHRILALDVKQGHDAATLVKRLSAVTGQKLTLRRVATGNRALVVLPVGATAATLAAISVAAQSDASVASVDRVRVMKHQWIPNDTLFGQQWALGSGLGGIRAPQAWDLTPSGAVAVAVIDTGIRPHADLDGKYVSGYDMISDSFIAVDGDLRDADPADPGDADIDLDCSGPLEAFSSWHGTHVAGILAAAAQNGEGIAGVAPNARVQSVRGLGRCGGTWEDIADSVRWAAGVPVPGAAANPNPVKVMNLSLGGAGDCNANLQSAIDAAVARGASVVVSAGNDATFSSLFAPANCKGVIAVGASNLLGDLSSYSNFGPGVAISAPGGDFGDLPGVLSTLNGGGTQPTVPSYASYRGTSMAAPHVAGVIALMLARDPSLTPGQVLNRLQSSSRVFPAGTDCSGAAGACGAGLLDAANAVASVALNRGINEVASNGADRVHIVEMVNPVNGRYTLSADPVEIARMTSSGWSKTGYLIPTYSFTTIGQSVAVPQPVCRAQLLGHEAWLFSVNAGECKQYTERSWMKADGVVFAAALPNANTCPSGSSAVWEMARLEANGLYNLRTISDAAEIARMTTAGWGYSRVAFCAPN
jgi:subtilisin family serine protease